MQSNQAAPERQAVPGRQAAPGRDVLSIAGGQHASVTLEFNKGLKPDSIMSVSDWADTNRVY